MITVRKLGKKQTEDNLYWASLWENISEVVSKPEIDALVHEAVSEIESVTSGKKAAYAWSGGKDSQALRGVCEIARVQLCMFGMSNLEYPEFLKWVTDTMPWELTVINTGQDLDWLRKHEFMLFPQNSLTAGKWFKGIQHTAQEIYYRREKLDMLILGRRIQDGNYCGEDGVYTNSKGICRFSPLRHWTHEQIMGFCHYYNYSLPPIYSWVNGWVVGTGAWAARQWTKSIPNGWAEVFSIDPSIVVEASHYLDSARKFLGG